MRILTTSLHFLTGLKCPKNNGTTLQQLHFNQPENMNEDVKVHCVTFLVEGLSNAFLHGDVIALFGMFHSVVLKLSIFMETKPDQVTGQICREATPLTVRMPVFLRTSIFLSYKPAVT
ncbi:hypothetical protein NL108_003301 [Boleophthalmus pectinirostris]|nr:hypothetical protein NL108_003301 [Boleophthalmus pectinirostris]